MKGYFGVFSGGAEKEIDFTLDIFVDKNYLVTINNMIRKQHNNKGKYTPKQKVSYIKERLKYTIKIVDCKENKFVHKNNVKEIVRSDIFIEDLQALMDFADSGNTISEKYEALEKVNLQSALAAKEFEELVPLLDQTFNSSYGKSYSKPIIDVGTIRALRSYEAESSTLLRDLFSLPSTSDKHIEDALSISRVGSATKLTVKDLKSSKTAVDSVAGASVGHIRAVKKLAIMLIAGQGGYIRKAADVLCIDPAPAVTSKSAESKVKCASLKELEMLIKLAVFFQGKSNDQIDQALKLTGVQHRETRQELGPKAYIDPFRRLLGLLGDGYTVENIERCCSIVNITPHYEFNHYCEDAVRYLLSQSEETLQRIAKRKWTYEKYMFESMTALRSAEEARDRGGAKTPAEILRYQQIMQEIDKEAVLRVIKNRGCGGINYRYPEPHSVIRTIRTIEAAIVAGELALNWISCSADYMSKRLEEKYKSYKNLCDWISFMHIDPIEVAKRMVLTLGNYYAFGHLDLFPLKMLSRVTCNTPPKRLDMLTSVKLHAAIIGYKELEDKLEVLSTITGSAEDNKDLLVQLVEECKEMILANTDAKNIAKRKAMVEMQQAFELSFPEEEPVAPTPSAPPMELNGAGSSPEPSAPPRDSDDGDNSELVIATEVPRGEEFRDSQVAEAVLVTNPHSMFPPEPPSDKGAEDKLESKVADMEGKQNPYG